MQDERVPIVYILASGLYGTLYIAVTSDLTARYHVHRLVHYEAFGDMEHAILRGKQLKLRHRQGKINLINEGNPHWADLAVGLGLEPLAPDMRRNGP